MIEINAGLLSIFITVLSAIILLSVAWGRVTERQKNDRKDIDRNKDDIALIMRTRASDLKRIYDKLDEVKDLLIDGKK